MIADLFACPCPSDDTLTTDWIAGAAPAPATGAKEHPDFWIQKHWDPTVSEMRRGSILLYSTVHESKQLWDRFIKKGCRFFSALTTTKSLAGSYFSPFLSLSFLPPLLWTKKRSGSQQRERKQPPLFSQSCIFLQVCREGSRSQWPGMLSGRLLLPFADKGKHPGPSEIFPAWDSGTGHGWIHHTPLPAVVGQSHQHIYELRYLYFWC